jgi:hypothetical protein
LNLPVENEDGVIMPTVFDTLSERFFTAYCEPDVKKRRKALGKWLDSAAPVMQKAIKKDLRGYLDQILETRWTKDGWQTGMKKFQRIVDIYRLVMNVQITDTTHMKYLRIVDPASPAEKAKTKRLMETTISGFEEANTEKVAVSKNPIHHEDSEDDDGGNGSGGGRSPNDDRSDAMNPNNPAYHAAADNRSNQMNPNNPAYHSSRGHGRR